MSINIRKESGAPTENTVGFIGEIYEDTNTGTRYECVGMYKISKSNGNGPDCEYVWDKIDMIEEKRIPGGSGGASSWNDLEDKPFEDNKFCIEYDFAVIPDVAINDGGMYWYKISDLIPTYEELLGARVVDKYDGYVEYDVILTSEDLNAYEDSLAGFSTPMSSFTVVYKTNEMFPVSETGLYYGCTTDKVEYLGEMSGSLIYGNIKKIEGKFVSVPRYDYIKSVGVGNEARVSHPDGYDDAYYDAYLALLSDMKEAKRAEFAFEFDNGHGTYLIEVVANCTNVDEEYHFTTLFPFQYKLYAFDFMTDDNGENINIEEICDFGALPS